MEKTPESTIPANKILIGLEALRSIPGKLLAGGIVIYFLYQVGFSHLSESWPAPAPFGDASILFSGSRQVWHSGNYLHLIFPYPPSAVMILHLLSLGGGRAFMLVWLLLMAGGVFVCMRGAVAAERPEVRSLWLLAGTIGLITACYPVGWDLHNANSNMVALGLIFAGYGMLGGLPFAGGVLVGTSVCLKPFSFLLVPWLVWKGPRRAAAGAVAAGAFWAIILPLLIFGTRGTVSLFHGWLSKLVTLAAPGSYLRFPAAPVVCLRKAAAQISGGGPSSRATVLVLALFWALWTIALGWYFKRAISPSGNPPPGSPARRGAPSRGVLADWTVLLLAPLPFSSWLEPYHVVALFPGVILLAAVALDRLTRQTDRLIALGGIGLLLSVRLLTNFSSWPLRGIALCAAMGALVLSLGLLRPRFVERTREELQGRAA